MGVGVGVVCGGGGGGGGGGSDGGDADYGDDDEDDDGVYGDGDACGDSGRIGNHDCDRDRGLDEERASPLLHNFDLAPDAPPKPF